MADSDPDCLFCKIVAGEIPSTKVYEDEHAFAFADQQPAGADARPGRPASGTSPTSPTSAATPRPAPGCSPGSARWPRRRGWTSFRTVFNTGAEARQTVFHVHAHVLAGRPMGWPPG